MANPPPPTVIDAKFLQALVCNEASPGLVEAFAPILADRLPAAQIDTPLRLAHFLAQAAVETWMFRRLEEDLSYRAARIAVVWPPLKARADLLAMNPEALGNAAYANINGNGDEASGDGYRFRGRGLFCLTGRANYDAADKTLGDPARHLTEDPDLVSEPVMAVQTTISFWHARNINEAADADDISRVTKLVNGACLAIADRAIIKSRALKLLGK
jgi:putative chitinase